MIYCSKYIIIILLCSFSIFAQSKPYLKTSSDSLKNAHLQKILETKIDINDIGIIKSPTARIMSDIEIETKALTKLHRGDTVLVKEYYTKNKVCLISFKQYSGYIDEAKLVCQGIIDFRDSIQNDIEANRQKNWEKWEAKRLEIERQEDSLTIIAEQKFTKEMIKKYGKKWGKIVGNKQIMIGMTKEMVLDSWGDPKDINRSVGSWGVHEQWVYGNNQYLYFENGKLTSWQD